MSHIILTPLSVELRTVIVPPHTVRFSVAGPKGDAGQGIIWRGDYSETTAYVAMDAVVYNGSSYICEVACTGVAPTEEANWALMAAASGDWEVLDLGSFV